MAISSASLVVQSKVQLSSILARLCAPGQQKTEAGERSLIVRARAPNVDERG